MINRKLKATLSLVLALIVMCSACVVPAFALDDVSEGGLTQNVAILKVVSTMVDRVKAQGGTLDDKNYIAYWYAPNEYGIYIMLISFPTDHISATNGKFNISRFSPEIYCDYSNGIILRGMMIGILFLLHRHNLLHSLILHKKFI